MKKKLLGLLALPLAFSAVGLAGSKKEIKETEALSFSTSSLLDSSLEYEAIFENVAGDKKGSSKIYLASWISKSAFSPYKYLVLDDLDEIVYKNEIEVKEAYYTYFALTKWMFTEPFDADFPDALGVTRGLLDHFVPVKETLCELLDTFVAKDYDLASNYLNEYAHYIYTSINEMYPLEEKAVSDYYSDFRKDLKSSIYSLNSLRGHSSYEIAVELLNRYSLIYGEEVAKRAKSLVFQEFVLSQKADFYKMEKEQFMKVLHDENTQRKLNIVLENYGYFLADINGTVAETFLAKTLIEQETLILEAFDETERYLALAFIILPNTFDGELAFKDLYDTYASYFLASVLSKFAKYNKLLKESLANTESEDVPSVTVDYLKAIINSSISIFYKLMDLGDCFSSDHLYGTAAALCAELYDDFDNLFGCVYGDLIEEYETPTYSWSGNVCTATSGDITEVVEAKYIIDSPATCEENETGHYVATFESEAFRTQITGTNSVVKEGSALGHYYIYGECIQCGEAQEDYHAHEIPNIFGWLYRLLEYFFGD